MKLSKSLTAYLAEAKLWMPYNTTLKVEVVGDELHLSYKGEGTFVMDGSKHYNDICHCSESAELDWIVSAIASEANLRVMNILD